MAELPKTGSSVGAKVMLGLAACTVLGIGLCGVGVVSANHATLQGYAAVAGAFCFFGGLLGMIMFGAGWAIFALGQKLFGNKE